MLFRRHLHRWIEQFLHGQSFGLPSVHKTNIRYLSIFQTSMAVPEPVISLSIKAKGLETPNFSRALNLFQKEDPTFKVHLDPASKEVCNCSLSFLSLSFQSSSLSTPLDHHLWHG